MTDDCGTCGGLGFIERASGPEARFQCPECAPPPACTNHPDRPSRINLDGDELCQACADAWCRAEGQWAAEQAAEEAELRKAP